MSWLADYYRSTVGKKFVMAITGLILFAYVVAHMLGNMQIYRGPEQLNAYGAFLHSETAVGLLWSARAVLLLTVGLHILAAVQLTIQSWGSRPVRYVKQAYQRADYAARTMIWSGPLIAFFIVYHILQLTTGTVEPVPFTHGEIYSNVVGGFMVPYVSALYIVAMIFLGLHFYHGLWSWFQTLGWNHPSYNRSRRGFAIALSLIIVIGNISIPAMVLAGVLTMNGGPQ